MFRNIPHIPLTDVVSIELSCPVKHTAHILNILNIPSPKVPIELSCSKEHISHLSHIPVTQFPSNRHAPENIQTILRTWLTFQEEMVNENHHVQRDPSLCLNQHHRHDGHTSSLLFHVSLSSCSADFIIVHLFTSSLEFSSHSSKQSCHQIFLLI